VPLLAESARSDVAPPLDDSAHSSRHLRLASLDAEETARVDSAVLFRRPADWQAAWALSISRRRSTRERNREAELELA
jgi:hypothetical protein